MRSKLYDIFPEISESCKGCEFPDCKGYIFLLEDEVDKFVDHDIEVVCLNENVFLINNFKTNDEGVPELGEISPKCKLRCCNGSCSVQDFKPLICLLYPIIPEEYKDGKHYWSLHKHCQYYHDLEASGEKDKVINEFFNVLDNTSEELMEKIIISYKNLSDISDCYYTSNDIEIIREVNLNV